MTLLRLNKIIATRDHKASAVWIVQGHPWVIIGKWEIPEEPAGWKIIVHDPDEDPSGESKLSPSYKVSELKNRLEGQTFLSRKEALEALEVGLNMLGLQA